MAHRDLARLIRDVPDWPEPGVTFRDVTPLLSDAEAFQSCIDALVRRAQEIASGPIDKVVGIEARGFIFGAPVALALGAGFVPARKAGKLPAETYAATYELEYGTATVEIHRDALRPGERVLVVDDVLATGGTMVAVNRLVTRADARVVADVVVLELTALGGRGILEAHEMSERLGALHVL